MENFAKIVCFFFQGFLSQILKIHRAAGEGRDHALFLSTISTLSLTFRPESRGRKGPCFILLYHFYPPINIHTGQQRKEVDHALFLSTTSTLSLTFRHLFETLHVRCLPHIFNRIACNYQTFTRWDLHLLELPFDWLMMQSIFLFVYLVIWF